MFIVGAGASRAAFPNGDRNGIPVPLMNDVVAIIGLEPILAKHGYSYGGENFEDVYSKLSGLPNHVGLTLQVEDKVRGYFAQI